jgi:hypothetical protein
MNITVIAILFSATVFMAYLTGRVDGRIAGRKEEKKNSFKSLRDTMDEWLEAQKEAGVSEEQLIKINEVLAQKMMKEFSGLAKDL